VRTARAFLESRPVAAEVEAIERVTALAGAAGAALHIVHVSSGRGVAAAAAARARGVNVSIETCPHYLSFTEDDLERLGSVAKCAPPLRPAADQQALWDEIGRGRIDIIGSDHSPTTPENKAGDIFAAWGGVAGVQSTLAVMLESGHHSHGLALARVADLLAATPARRFRIGGKGSIAPGNDADLVLVDLSRSFTLRAEDLLQRHPSSPYLGRRFRGHVRRTLRRGETIFHDGRITARKRGRFVCPTS